jgi:hypothetical protein
MKLLICGECPDSLSNVALSLNRLRGDQIRPALLPIVAHIPDVAKSSSQPAEPAAAKATENPA